MKIQSLFATTILAIAINSELAMADNTWDWQHNGRDNGAIRDQSGDLNEAHIFQIGDENQIDVHQSGLQNRLNAEQYGNGNHINATQEGQANNLVTRQKGDGNRASTYQAFGSGNSIFIDQAGYSTHTSIQQRGSNNHSYIRQRGTDTGSMQGGVKERTYGNNNNVLISQINQGEDSSISNEANVFIGQFFDNFVANNNQIAMNVSGNQDAQGYVNIGRDYLGVGGLDHNTVSMNVNNSIGVANIAGNYNNFTLDVADGGVGALHVVGSYNFSNNQIRSSYLDAVIIGDRNTLITNQLGYSNYIDINLRHVGMLSNIMNNTISATQVGDFNDIILGDSRTSIGATNNIFSFKQNGSYNLADISVGNNANLTSGRALISQDGVGNSAGIGLRDAGYSTTVGSNDAVIGQHGADQVAGAVETGDHNTTFIQQYNSRNQALSASVGSGNHSNILQNGVHNTVGGTDTPGAPPNLGIQQIGDLNITQIAQAGNDNSIGDNELYLSGIEQIGNHNKAVVSQVGNNNLVVGEELPGIVQHGDSNTASIVQNGNGNSGSIAQYGNNHFAVINQQGDNNITRIIQR